MHYLFVEKKYKQVLILCNICSKFEHLSDTSIYVYSNFNVQQLAGWLNANGYKYAMLYLDANINDACLDQKLLYPKVTKNRFKKNPRSGPFS